MPKAPTDAEQVQKLVEEHLPFVLGLARCQRHDRWIQTDDLESVAAETLLRISDRFDASREMSFRNYVAMRVKGAMLDHMRQWNRVRMARLHGVTEIPFSVVAGADRDFQPPDRLGISFVEELELKELVTHLLRGTTEREKKILLWYFGDGLSLKEIGLELRVSESRASMILKSLRLRLGAYDGKLHPRSQPRKGTWKRTAPRNQKPRRDQSRFGIGVRKSPSGRFQSTVLVNRKRIHLGMFDTAEEAQAARRNYMETA